MSGSPAKKSGNVQVVCRIRPQNEIETRNGGRQVVHCDPNGQTVEIRGEECDGEFTFDRVFGPDSRQVQVYEFAASTIVADVMAGYNGTIFAYGQTSSGKTFTMMGPSIDDEEYKGLIPRIVESFFDCIMDADESLEFTVKVSYFEIYMEKIRDLLNTSARNLQVREDPVRGVYVEGCEEVYVGSVDEVFAVMEEGQSARMVAATNMNAYSSRSHSIFVITISQYDTVSLSTKSGKLYLVDLAGSERISKTGAEGTTRDEAKTINASLSALGLVINNLTDGKSTHIPYRDSKLTRVLQESLGGNSRTLLVINCSPSSYNEGETMSTLRFGMRAKRIENKAKINAERSPAEMKALLAKQEKEIERLKAYIAVLEEELVALGGTAPEGSPIKGAAGGGATGGDSASGQQMTPNTKARLPNVAAMQEQLKNLEDERESFLAMHDTIVASLEEKDDELTTLRAAVEEANSTRAAIRKELDAAKEALQTFEINAESDKFELRSLTETLEELRKENESLRASLPPEGMTAEQAADAAAAEADKNAKLQMLMSTMGSADSTELAERERQLRLSLKDTVVRMDSMGRALEGGGGEDAATAAVAAAAAAAVAQDLEAHEAEVSDLKAKLAAAEEAAADSAAAAADATASAEDLKAQLAAAAAERDELEAARVDLTVAAEFAAAREDGLKSELRSAEEELEEARAAVEETTAERDAFAAQIESLKASLATAEKAAAAAKAAVATEAASHADSKRALDDATERVAELTAELARVDGQRKEAEAARVASDARVLELESKTSDLTGNQDEMASKVESLVAEVNESRRAASEWEEERRRYEAAEAAATNNLRRLQSEVDELQGAREGLQSTKTRLEEAIADLESDNAAAQSALADANAKLAKALSDAAKKDASLAKSKSELARVEAEAATAAKDATAAVEAARKRAESTIAELKTAHESELAALRESLGVELTAANARVAELVAEKEALEATSAERSAAMEKELAAIKAESQRQLEEFDELKTQLTEDVQDRCEKVIELQMDMDIQREEYSRLLSADKRTLHKKVKSMEKTLSEMATAQADLSRANSSFQHSAKLNEKRLASAKDHIAGLEALVGRLQRKLAEEREKYEAEIQRYAALLATGGLTAEPQRRRSVQHNIAKPIRGGGGSRKRTPGGSGGDELFPGSPPSMRKSIRGGGSKRSSGKSKGKSDGGDEGAVNTSGSSDKSPSFSRTPDVSGDPLGATGGDPLGVTGPTGLTPTGDKALDAEAVIAELGPEYQLPESPDLVADMLEDAASTQMPDTSPPRTSGAGGGGGVGGGASGSPATPTGAGSAGGGGAAAAGGGGGGDGSAAKPRQHKRRRSWGEWLLGTPREQVASYGSTNGAGSSGTASPAAPAAATGGIAGSLPRRPSFNKLFGSGRSSAEPEYEDYTTATASSSTPPPNQTRPVISAGRKSGGRGR